jgi:RHS repeat-associated protein
LLGEYDGNGNVDSEIVYLGSMPVALLKQIVLGSTVTTPYYIYTDHIDTPRVITRASDNLIVWRWDQVDPFGFAPANENPQALGVFTSNARFPGQLYDKETKLHYNWHRDYDPQLGRYVQSDPIGLEGGLNTYAYVEGNPVNYVDENGLSRRGGTIYRGTGDMAGQIWDLNSRHNGAIRKYDSLQRKANGLWRDDIFVPRDGKPVCRTVCPNAGGACRSVPNDSLPAGNGCYTRCDGLVLTPQ